MNPEFSASLPTIERSIEKDMEVLMGLLDAYYEENRYQMLVDNDLETDPVIIQYIDCLDAFLHDQPNKDSWRATYGAMNFAFMTSGLAGWDTDKYLTLDYFWYLDERTSGSQREQFIEEVQEYLGNSDTLNGLIGIYMPELDPTSQYADSVELMVAFVCMQLEYTHLVRRETKNLDKEIQANF